MGLLANIIHMPDRGERVKVLMQELKNQNIKLFKLWEGVHDIRGVKHGVNAAHKQIISDAQYRGLREVLVMEDDIKFCGDRSFDYFMSNKPTDFDIYLAGVYLGDINEHNQINSFSGFHCYIVAERFYDTFLSTPDDEHIDRSLANKGKYIVCNPFAAIQYNGWSDNCQKDMNYDSLLANRSLYG